MNATTSITKASIKDISIVDLLGSPIAPKAPKAPKAPRVSRATMTPEELKAKRNEAQRALRSTPEGKAYANAASKKSIALRKEKLAAELAALKATVALLLPPTEEVAVEQEAPVVVVVEQEAPKKASTKKASTKKAMVPAEF